MTYFEQFGAVMKVECQKTELENYISSIPHTSILVPLTSSFPPRPSYLYPRTFAVIIFYELCS
jgi:hypothetical protein